ncbi:hypothetical protein D9619_004066 [Psilocybe cf. subviscida]|uniref:Aminotransferase class I/classII large domain-containing protein n=1 Tax=Psilocybe cf. subviscida TaxID=2480587 RepID=A0A8H5BP76_9AGAR|nr:hypothetical protein D9619_004066 [Psilocybe cf. subviscida]
MGYHKINSPGPRLDIACGMGFVLETGLFSIYTCLFIAALPVLTSARRLKDARSAKSAWMFLVFSILMYIVEVAHIIFAGVRFYRSTFRQFDAKDRISYLQNRHNWEFAGLIILVYIQTWLGDALVIYRCYFVWDNNMWLISIPVCLLLGTIGINTYIISQIPFYNTVPISLVRSIYPLAFSQNFMTTSLIILKFVLQHRESKKAGVVMLGSKLGLIHVVRILIESAAIYTIQLLVLNILFSLSHNFQYVIQPAIVPSIGITFVLLALRIEASRHEGVTTKSDLGIRSSMIPRWIREADRETGPHDNQDHSSMPARDEQQVAVEGDSTIDVGSEMSSSSPTRPKATASSSLKGPTDELNVRFLVDSFPFRSQDEDYVRIEEPAGDEPRFPVDFSLSLQRLPVEFYSDFLSDLAKQRKPSPIRTLFPLEKVPGVISLLAGKPNASTFPFTSLSFNARSPSDPDSETKLTIDGAELTQGLQYGDTSGLKGLLDWLHGLQGLSHGRKMDEVHAMVNPGDAVFVESPVYAGVIPMFSTMGCKQIEVETDSQGIKSSSLREILEQWPVGVPKPKVLYTVPYGCNPTGMTATLERRKEVLKLAHEHNFIILEDDPYFYLYYGKEPRYPSYFQLELEEPEVGRVLRFDSLSKVLSAGIRIGFASGPEALLNAIDRHTATSNLQVSSLTQTIVYKLLDAWGHTGFVTHTKRVASFYAHKRDIFERAMQKHLAGLAEWSTPEAGMFFWFKLLLNDDVAVREDDGDSKTVIETTAFGKGVLALPGTVFLPNGRKTAYVRASFSLTSEEDVDKAFARLREAILEARATAKAPAVPVV